MIIVQPQYNDIQIFGLRRSGNHAIINWLIGHYNSIIHFNNCRIVNNEIQIRKEFINQIGDSPQVRILNFEDYSLDELCILPKSQNRILILRDPYNNFASRIKRKYIKNEYYLNVWKDYAKEFLNLTNVLNCNIKISFNEWFLDINYRKNISNNLNLKFTDKNINNIYKYAKGSSFDDYDYENNASKMLVNSRWKQMIKNEYYNNLLNDCEIAGLNQILFGFRLRLPSRNKIKFL